MAINNPLPFQPRRADNPYAAGYDTTNMTMPYEDIGSKVAMAQQLIQSKAAETAQTMQAIQAAKQKQQVDAETWEYDKKLKKLGVEREIALNKDLSDPQKEAALAGVNTEIKNRDTMLKGNALMLDQEHQNQKQKIQQVIQMSQAIQGISTKFAQQALSGGAPTSGVIPQQVEQQEQSLYPAGQRFLQMQQGGLPAQQQPFNQSPASPQQAGVSQSQEVPAFLLQSPLTGAQGARDKAIRAKSGGSKMLNTKAYSDPKEPIEIDNPEYEYARKKKIDQESNTLGEQRQERLIKQQQFANSTKLRQEFINRTEVKDYILISPNVKSMESFLEKAKNGDVQNMVALDQGLITLYNKLTDPQSVVRESEYARTPGNLPLVNRLYGVIEKVKKGGAGLTNEDRAALVQGAKIIANERGKQFQSTKQEYQGLAADYGLDENLITRDIPDFNEYDVTSSSVNAESSSPESNKVGKYTRVE